MEDTEIKNWSNEKFIKAVDQLQKLEGNYNKIELIYSLTLSCEAAMLPVFRTIRDEVYCFGLHISNGHEAEEIANVIIDKYVHEWFPRYENDLDVRINKCFSIVEKKLLLEEEKAVIREKVFPADIVNKDYNGYYKKGYSTYKTKKKLNFHLPVNIDYKHFPLNFTSGVFMLIAYGICGAKLEAYVEELLREIEDGKSFLKEIKKLNSLETVTEKMEYYISVTKQSFEFFKETVSQRICNQDYYLSVIFSKTPDLKERGRWFINKFLAPEFESMKNDYEERLAQCSNLIEKNDLTNSILREIENNLIDTDSIKFDGYIAQKEKKQYTLRRETFKELHQICSGMILYKLESYIKDSIANNFASTEILNNKVDHKIKPPSLYPLIPDFSDFDELFQDLRTIEKCYGILKEEEFINEKFEYIGNNKGAFVIWVRALVKKALIRHCTDDIYATLLNKKFPGLQISSSLFRANNIRAERNYKKIFESLL